MSDILLNILSLGLKPLYEKNYSYFSLIDNFRKKLPRPQNMARKLTKSEKESHPLITESMMIFNVVDLSTHKTSISEQDLDIFINSVKYFNYDWMIFRRYYKAYSDNILRFKPISKDGNLDLVVLQEVLKEDPIRPLKPFSVILYHLKFHFKLTSAIYLKLSKKRKIVHNK
jgi:hypothetical protein